VCHNWLRVFHEWLVGQDEESQHCQLRTQLRKLIRYLTSCGNGNLTMKVSNVGIVPVASNSHITWQRIRGGSS